MKPKIFKKKIQVQESHLDELRHVNNVVYLQWVQDIAKDHWATLTTNAIELKYYWVVIDHFIQYKNPALLHDLISAITFVSSNKGVKSMREVQFFKEGMLLAHAKTNWCLLDRKSGRPIRIPDELINLFQE